MTSLPATAKAAFALTQHIPLFPISTRCVLVIGIDALKVKVAVPFVGFVLPGVCLFSNTKAISHLPDAGMNNVSFENVTDARPLEDFMKLFVAVLLDPDVEVSPAGLTIILHVGIAMELEAEVPMATLILILADEIVSLPLCGIVTLPLVSGTTKRLTS